MFLPSIPKALANFPRHVAVTSSIQSSTPILRAVLQLPKCSSPNGAARLSCARLVKRVSDNSRWSAATSKRKLSSNILIKKPTSLWILHLAPGESISPALVRGFIVQPADSNVIMTTGSKLLRSNEHCIERDEMQTMVLSAFFSFKVLIWQGANGWGITTEWGSQSQYPSATVASSCLRWHLHLRLRWLFLQRAFRRLALIQKHKDWREALSAGDKRGFGFVDSGGNLEGSYSRIG